MKDRVRAILFGAIILMIGLMSIKKLEEGLGIGRNDTYSTQHAFIERI